MKQIKAGKKTIFFNDTDGRHLFTDEKGKKIDSVTTFTSVLDKPALIPWAVKLTKEYLCDRLNRGEAITAYDIEEAGKQHRMKKEKAADTGTAIHELCSKWIKKEKFDIPDDEQIRNGFNAFLNFQKEHKVKWLSSEFLVYSAKYNYAGICDAVGLFEGKNTLIDFKSSNGIWPEMSFQVAGYQLAMEEMGLFKVERRILIRFGKDTGDFEWRELPDYKKDKNAFLACITLRRALKDK